MVILGILYSLHIISIFFPLYCVNYFRVQMKLLFLLLLFQVALFYYPFFRRLKEITFFGQVHLKALLLALQWQLQLL